MNIKKQEHAAMKAKLYPQVNDSKKTPSQSKPKLSLIPLIASASKSLPLPRPKIVQPIPTLHEKNNNKKQPHHSKKAPSQSKLSSLRPAKKRPVLLIPPPKVQRSSLPRTKTVYVANETNNPTIMKKPPSLGKSHGHNSSIENKQKKKKTLHFNIGGHGHFGIKIAI